MAQRERPEPTLGSILQDIGRVALVGLGHLANEYFGSSYVSSAVDYSQALLTITRLLGQLKGEEEYEIPKLVAEIPALVRVQQRYREQRMRERKHPEEEADVGSSKKKKKKKKEKPVPKLSTADIEELQVWMNHSLASYGVTQFSGMGLAPRRDVNRLWTDEDCVSYLTGMKAKHIYKLYADHGLYKPGYYVAVDHKRRSIVIAVRGSNSAQDAMVDIVCEQEDYEFAGDPEHTKGKVHIGFLNSAQGLDAGVRSLVTNLLNKYKEYRFIITGHSYGGAVATILGLMYVDVFKDRPPHVYAFAPPCSLCPALAKSPFARKHVTSCVHDDDVVCRLGISTLVDIRRILYAFHKAKDATDNDKFELYAKVEREHNDLKLFPGGNTWVIESELYYKIPTFIDQVEELGSIQVTMMFIANHLPPSYYKAVHSLDRFKE